jgi:hypothetical protein
VRYANELIAQARRGSPQGQTASSAMNIGGRDRRTFLHQ